MATEIQTENLFAEMLRRVTAANEPLKAKGVLPAGIDLSRITVEPLAQLVQARQAREHASQIVPGQAIGQV